MLFDVFDVLQVKDTSAELLADIHMEGVETRKVSFVSNHLITLRTPSQPTKQPK